MTKRKKKKSLFRVLIGFAVIVSLLVGFLAYFFSPFLYYYLGKVEGEAKIVIGLNENDMNQVVRTLYNEKIIDDTAALIYVLRTKNVQTFKYGQYSIASGTSIRSLVNRMILGNTTTKITFNNIHTLEQLSEILSEQLPIAEETLVEVLTDEKVAQKYGFTKETFIAMFLPNTYEVYYHTDVTKILDKIALSYKQYWNSGREQKRVALGLTQVEVVTLASIVEKETIKPDEMPIVAGLYLNRLNRGILLQADPTVKFALKEPTRQRILKRDLKIDSPYNTYKYTGLPPGPIGIPSLGAIDAVLNYVKHEYLFMCAKEDFSGYHNFAKTNREHMRNARKYQKALNRRRIYE